MLSIRPQFAEAIVRGEKRFEFRRSIFKQPIDTVVIYATVPVRRVIGEFRVQSILREPPEVLWRRTRHAAGIAERQFFDYFDGKAIGYAIEIGEVRRYRTPYCPTEQHGVRPPQSFLYLDAGH